MAWLTLSAVILKDRVNFPGKGLAQLTLSAINLTDRVNLQKILRYFLVNHGSINTLTRKSKESC